MLAVEHVIGGIGLDLPLLANVHASENDGDLEVVTLDIVANFLCKVPVERNSNDFDVVYVTPSTQAAQILHQGAKK